MTDTESGWYQPGEPTGAIDAAAAGADLRQSYPAAPQPFAPAPVPPAAPFSGAQPFAPAPAAPQPSAPPAPPAFAAPSTPDPYGAATLTMAPPVVGAPPFAPASPVVDLTDAGFAPPAPLVGHLAASNVSCWFSGRKVLERCTLDMHPGRVTALIGPSGCGKSTFLRTLNRMHELVRGAQFGGTITLDGVDIYGETTTPAEVRTNIGMVFQKPNPFPAMSISENVLAGLRLTGRSSERDDLVEESLQRAGLWNEVKDRLHDGGMSLSGGQQQRLCIARALAVRPRVLLMDEPCSALDPISTRVIEDTIAHLRSEITIVIVTHNMQQAQRVSDDCAFFLVDSLGEPGRIVEFGETAKVFGSPDDPRTRDYVTGRFG